MPNFTYVSNQRNIAFDSDSTLYLRTGTCSFPDIGENVENRCTDCCTIRLPISTNGQCTNCLRQNTRLWLHINAHHWCQFCIQEWGSYSSTGEDIHTYNAQHPEYGPYDIDEHEDDSEDDSEDADIYGYHDTTPMLAHYNREWLPEDITPRSSLCFGVELEMEGKRGVSQGALTSALGGRDGGNVTGKYILMNDGSLDMNGVELITCPYTLDFHQKKFEWDKLLTPLAGIARSGAGTTNCGIHVHVNRMAISALTLGKMLVFCNHDNNASLIKRIAQRDPSQWGRLLPKKLTNGLDSESPKYEALHIGNNTIEFRIFRGNLRPDRVLKNIEFCHSVVTYCQTASIKAVENYEGYLMFLSKNRSTYKNLIKFLGESYGFKNTQRGVNVAETEEV